MTMTAEEVANAVLNRHAIRDDWRRTGEQIRKLLVEAVELAESEADRKRGSMVLTRGDSLEDDNVEVFDVDALYNAPGEYEDDDVEQMVAGLRSYGWDSVADDVEKWWKERSDAR